MNHSNHKVSVNCTGSGTDKIADGRMKKQAQKQDGDSDRPDYFRC